MSQALASRASPQWPGARRARKPRNTPLPPTAPLELALPGCARRIRLMVWPQIREGALARHCHFRFAKGAGRWTSVWASLRERGKAKRPPHVGPEKVVLPAASPKELGSDLPGPKKDARQPVILRCGFWCPGRDVCGSRRSPNRGRSKQFGVHPGHACLSTYGVLLLVQSGSAAANLFLCRNREPRGVTTADCPSCCPLGCSRPTTEPDPRIQRGQPMRVPSSGCRCLGNLGLM